eukprot:Skav233524  [mRNA]  locus=scaffold2975:245179:252420:- [translate_table: standard]
MALESLSQAVDNVVVQNTFQDAVQVQDDYDLQPRSWRAPSFMNSRNSCRGSDSTVSGEELFTVQTESSVNEENLPQIANSTLPATGF